MCICYYICMYLRKYIFLFVKSFRYNLITYKTYSVFDENTSLIAKEIDPVKWLIVKHSIYLYSFVSISFTSYVWLRLFTLQMQYTFLVTN